MKACQFWQQVIWAFRVILPHGGQVSGSAAFSVKIHVNERGHILGRDTLRGKSRLRSSDVWWSLWKQSSVWGAPPSGATFEVGRRGAEGRWKFSTKSQRRHVLQVEESNYSCTKKYTCLLLVFTFNLSRWTHQDLMPHRSDFSWH